MINFKYMLIQTNQWGNANVCSNLFPIYVDSECEPINWSVLLGREVGLNAEPIVPSVSGDVVFRLSIISYVFFAINLLWLIASILLLGRFWTFNWIEMDEIWKHHRYVSVALCTICCRRSLVNTWIGIAVLVVLADFGASGIFVWDLVYTYVSTVHVTRLFFLNIK